MSTSNKPYLVRAIHRWCLDCDYTPHVLACSEYDGVEVPEQYVTDGQIVFNISQSATKDLKIDNDRLTFLANFGQKVVQITLPMASILAVYAYENGDGITFDEDEIDISDSDDIGLSILDGGRAHIEAQDEMKPSEADVQNPGKKQAKKKPTLTLLK